MSKESRRRQRVASAPAAGQYSLVVATGIYTFAAADTGKAIKISYEYSASAGGQIYTMTNETMGYTPSFTLLLQNGYDGKTMVCKLNRCVSGKLSVPLKSDDFAIYDFEAEAFAAWRARFGNCRLDGSRHRPSRACRAQGAQAGPAGAGRSRRRRAALPVGARERQADA